MATHIPHADDDIRAAEFSRPAVTPRPSAPLIDLRKLWALVWRNRWTILAVGILAIAGGLAMTVLTTPRYDSIASVQIDQQAARVLETSAVDPGTIQDVDRFLQTQVEVLNSRALATRVGERERLFDDPRFFPAMHAEAPMANGTPLTGAVRREAVIGLLRANLAINLPRDSRIATIRFRSADRNFSARIANAFATNFIASNLERKIDSTKSARDLLSAQLGRTRQTLAASEQKLNAYARTANLIDTSATTGGSAGGARSSVTTSSLVALNDAYAAAQAERIGREGVWRTAQATRPAEMSEVLANQAVQSLLEQRAIKVATLTQDRQQRTDAYPRVARAKAEIGELDRQIATIAGNVRRSVEDQYRASVRKEDQLRAQVRRLTLDTLSEQDRSVQYGILRREVETQRTLYDTLLQRFNELSAASNAAANNVSLVDSAEPALSPAKPNPRFNLMFALAIGAIVAGGLILLREGLDDTLHAPADVEDKIGLPVLATVPILTGDPIADIDDPFSPAAEAYASLLVPLTVLTRHGLPRSICITSSQSAEGKTTSAYAIAVGLARRGRRVLLVDADLRRPSLERYLAMPNTIGLTNVLVGDATLAAATAQTETAGLDILKSGPLPPNPSETLGGGALTTMLAQAVALYDCVVIDAPPVLGLADALSVAAATEVTLFVVEANRTSLGRARNAVRRLRDAQVPVAGGVITRFNGAKIGLSHEYGRGYFSYPKA